MTVMAGDAEFVREELQILRGTLAGLVGDSPGARSAQAVPMRIAAALERDPVPPLARLADRLLLTPHAYTILLAAIGAASSLEIAALLERIQGDPVSGGIREHVLERIVGARGIDVLLAELAPDAPLRRWRLLERREEQVGVAFERWLAPRAVVAYAYGRPCLDEAHANAAELVQASIDAARELADDDRERLLRILEARHVASVSTYDPASAVRGLAGLGAELGLRTLKIDAGRSRAHGLELALRDALLLGALLVVEAPTEVTAQQLDELAELGRRAREAAVPCVVVEGSARTSALSRATDVWLRLSPPPFEVRRATWARAIEQGGGSASAEVVRSAAEMFAIGVAAIERAALRACHTATGPLAIGQLGAAVAADAPPIATTLGEFDTIDPTLSFDSLIVPPEVRDDLLDLLDRCRHRRAVFDDMKLGRLVSGRGVVALLTGPPGTGKTLAARLLATHLGLRLLRVDLSRVVSKWIGETEKNLAHVLDAAEEGRFMILFDEADALFGKRTSDTKSSTDRYSNMETNFLLQRLEAFDGIAVLTSNLERAIDDAFKRRLAARIEFPMPDEDAREQLWRGLLPASSALAEDEIRELAEAELSGGQIRNAILRAAFRATGVDTTPKLAHYRDAIQLELRAQGKLVAHRPRPS